MVIYGDGFDLLSCMIMYGDRFGSKVHELLGTMLLAEHNLNLFLGLDRKWCLFAFPAIYASQCLLHESLWIIAILFIGSMTDARTEVSEIL